MALRLKHCLAAAAVLIGVGAAVVLPLLEKAVAVQLPPQPSWPAPAAEEASLPAKEGAADKRVPPAGDVPEQDPFGPNGACYVCHMTFVKEELAQTHLKQAVGCTKCHGLSIKHANDEDIGASKPDICYPRDKVDASCGECHPTHDVPARKVLARFLERNLSSERTPICTDCHGTHKIQRAAEGTERP